MQFEFPGNVRQLENVCHWLTVMAPGQVVDAKDLPPELQIGLSGTLHAATTNGTAEPLSVVPGRIEALGAVMPDLPLASSSSRTDSAELPAPAWQHGLEREARSLLEGGYPEVWDLLTRKFEAQLIHTALEVTRGRRIEAAQKLGIGRNTITRKIQELGLEEERSSSR